MDGTKSGIRELMTPTAGGELPQCGDTLFREGHHVAIISGGSAKLIDRFVRELAEYAGVPVDWHYVGGRARVVTSGEPEAVKDAIRQLRLSVHTTHPE